MNPVYPGPPRRLFEQFNAGVQRAREAYDSDPNSTHRQTDDYTKRKPK